MPEGWAKGKVDWLNGWPVGRRETISWPVDKLTRDMGARSRLKGKPETG